jgi:hypothetical protein
MGFKPGVTFGKILKAADDAQDSMEFTDLEGAKLWLKKYTNL